MNNEGAGSHINSYILDSNWLVIRTRALRHRSEDVALLHTLRMVAFDQILEPPLWDGTCTIIEGRPTKAAERELDRLGFWSESSTPKKENPLECTA